MADQSAEAKASTLPPQAKFDEPDLRADPPGEPLTPEMLTNGGEQKWHAYLGMRRFMAATWAKLSEAEQGQWFDSAGEADMHRTETDAQITLHANRMATSKALEDSDGKPIQLSNQATDSAKAGHPEPGVIPAEIPPDEPAK